MRTILLATVAALVCGALGGCSGGDKAERPETYALPTQTARPDEKAMHLRPVSDGDTSFTLLGLTTGMPELVGSHADVRPRGRFTRVRLLVVNDGRTTALLDNTRQRLLSADGHSFPPDQNAMQVKRQPEHIDLGAAVRLEFDLWFDVPAGTKVSGFLLFGGPTLTDLLDKQGTELKLS
jgi:hypothetical protein